jgi:hypothetical protein
LFHGRGYHGSVLPGWNPPSLVKTTTDQKQIALDKVIVDVSVLAVEKCLIQKLPELLSPEIICNLTNEEVECIAHESEATAAERTQVAEKLTVLKVGLTELGRFKKGSHLSNRSRSVSSLLTEGAVLTQYL